MTSFSDRHYEDYVETKQDWEAEFGVDWDESGTEGIEREREFQQNIKERPYGAALSEMPYRCTVCLKRRAVRDCECGGIVREEQFAR